MTGFQPYNFGLALSLVPHHRRGRLWPRAWMGTRTSRWPAPDSHGFA